MAMQRGSLTVVSSGILLAGHCTLEARTAITGADIVYTMMGDQAHLEWARTLNARVEPLEHHYADEADRPRAYDAMKARILESVRAGLDVCAVFYGHAGVYVTPSHAAIAAARREGFEAIMLPGISAEACLYADLGLDPGRYGCQSFEARDFFLNARVWDCDAALLLWQIAVLGDASFTRFDPDPRALGALGEVLAERYGADHEATIYEAARLPTQSPRIARLRLGELAGAPVSQGSTLYVPARAFAAPCAARAALLERHLRGAA